MAKALVWKLEPALHAFVGSVQWLEISIHEAMAMNECQMTTLASLCRETQEKQHSGTADLSQQTFIKV